MNQDKLHVGIDVSSKNNVCYLMHSDGSKHSSFSVPNNRNGIMSPRNKTKDSKKIVMEV